MAASDPHDPIETVDGSDRPPGMPRWVKVFGLIAAVLILLLVIVAVAGGGNHGPQRHGGGGADDETPSSVTAHTAPAGGHAP